MHGPQAAPRPPILIHLRARTAQSRAVRGPAAQPVSRSTSTPASPHLPQESAKGNGITVLSENWQGAEESQRSCAWRCFACCCVVAVVAGREMCPFGSCPPLPIVLRLSESQHHALKYRSFGLFQLTLSTALHTPPVSLLDSDAFFGGGEQRAASPPGVHGDFGGEGLAQFPDQSPLAAAIAGDGATSLLGSGVFLDEPNQLPKLPKVSILLRTRHPVQDGFLSLNWGPSVPIRVKMI